MSIKVARQTITSAARFLKGADELARVEKFANHYQSLLKRLQKAVEKNDNKYADHLTHRILRSHAAKVSAVIRATKRKPGEPPLALKDIEARAAALNPFKPVPEPVHARFKPKLGADRWRMVLSFGLQRRALQTLCADIIRVRLPAHGFDYLEKGKKGAEGAVLRVKTLIEGGGYEHLLTVDIRNCFGSVDQKGVAKLLPLPEPVVNYVLLVQDHDIVKAELPAGTVEEDGEFISPVLMALYLQADTAARQGLPQGSSASNLIMSRAVLGPLLSATPFVDRLTLYGDDICVATHSEDEAEAILKTLSSLLEGSPAGPLSIGHHHVHKLVRFANYCKYKLKRMPWFYGGKVRFVPSPKCYMRFEQRVRDLCRDLPSQSWKDRADEYAHRWIKAFPLWKPNQLSLFYLDMTVQNAVQEMKESSKHVGAEGTEGPAEFAEGQEKSHEALR
jgi:hypothetical protein